MKNKRFTNGGADSNFAIAISREKLTKKVQSRINKTMTLLLKVLLVYKN